MTVTDGDHVTQVAMNTDIPYDYWGSGTQALWRLLQRDRVLPPRGLAVRGRLPTRQAQHRRVASAMPPSARSPDERDVVHHIITSPADPVTGHLHDGRPVLQLGDLDIIVASRLTTSAKVAWLTRLIEAATDLRDAVDVSAPAGVAS